MEPMQPMKPMAPMQPMKPAAPWWPPSLGDSPSSVGSQNDLRYAYFGPSNRLALQSGSEEVRVYDTTGHAISGARQEQGAIILSTAEGQIDLDKFAEVAP